MLNTWMNGWKQLWSQAKVNMHNEYASAHDRVILQFERI